MTCFHCRYFTGYIEKGGRCRFNPPVVIHDGSTVYPHVASDSFCAHHQPRQEPTVSREESIDRQIKYLAGRPGGITDYDISHALPLTTEEINASLQRLLDGRRIYRAESNGTQQVFRTLQVP